MVSTVNVAEAMTARAANGESHADLPKHAFGSCSICTRRLLSSEEATTPVVPHPRSKAALPTLFVVQTSPIVPDHPEGRG